MRTLHCSEVGCVHTRQRNISLSRSAMLFFHPQHSAPPFYFDWNAAFIPDIFKNRLLGSVNTTLNVENDPRMCSQRVLMGSHADNRKHEHRRELLGPFLFVHLRYYIFGTDLLNIVQFRLLRQESGVGQSQTSSSCSVNAASV